MWGEDLGVNGDVRATLGQTPTAGEIRWPFFSGVTLLAADSISDLTDPGSAGGPWRSCRVSRLKARRLAPSPLPRVSI